MTDRSNPEKPLPATTMDFQLTLTHVLERARGVAAEQEIVSRRPDGATHRYTYADFHDRACRLAGALMAAGLRKGERVGSLMWNSYGHLEAYYGVPAAGGVLHTINVRLHPDDIAYVINHAGVRFILVDDVLLDLWRQVPDHGQVERIFVFPLGDGRLSTALEDGEADYETLLDADPAPYPDIRETDPATLCYTGGTTGRPKGVVYSHRALILHAFAECMVDGFGYGRADTVLPVVPMFHVNAWGIPFSAIIAGAKLVLPGPRLDPDSLIDICKSERVTFAAGVPTVWSDMLNRLERGPAPKFASKFEILTGGSAPHQSLIEGYERYGITMLQGWGLTESSGVLTVSRLKPQMRDAPVETRSAYLAKQGIPLPITQLRVVDETGRALPWDGRSTGEIQVRGTSVTARYLHHDAPGKWTEDGFFRTGDIGCVDPLGYVTVLERTEDLIKSGGEWIVPLQLEDAILQCGAVHECAVIARQDTRWGERPVAVVVLCDGAELNREALMAALTKRFPKWWLPDDVVVVEELPRTPVGKIARKTLRERVAGQPDHGTGPHGE
jgi:fatty-acyl-CoA synthase